MIFTVRQLFEKSKMSPYLFYLLTFTRHITRHLEALWQVLRKYGVPPVMLSLIRSFHDDMTAVVRVSDGTTDDIHVRNGLRYRCTMAPVLFNLYLAAMVGCWRAHCFEAGVTVKHRMGRKLVGRRNGDYRIKVC